MSVINKIPINLIISIIILLMNVFLVIKVNKLDLPKVEQIDQDVIFEEIVKHSMKSEDSPVKDPLVYIGKDDSQITNLSSLVIDTTLIFRFSGESCNACIEYIIRKIKEYFPDYTDNSRIVFLTSDLNSRVKENYFGKKVVNLYLDNLGIPLEDFNVPYLFILDKQNISKMIFIPDETVPQMTEFYLRNIKERYLKN